MEVWQIGDSQPAPKFQVICSPNDWAKTIKETLSDTKLSATNLLQLDYWTEFNDYMSPNTWFKSKKPRPQHWYDIAIGNSKAYISLTVSFTQNHISCELYIPDNKELFESLNNEKTTIEKEIGLNLNWDGLPNAKASRISLRKPVPQLKNKGNWKGCFNWCADLAKKFEDVFPNYF